MFLFFKAVGKIKYKSYKPPTHLKVCEFSQNLDENLKINLVWPNLDVCFFQCTSLAVPYNVPVCLRAEDLTLNSPGSVYCKYHLSHDVISNNVALWHV